MDRIVIFGDTGFELRLSNIINSGKGLKVVAFCVDRAFKKSDSINGIPVIPLDELVDYYPPSDYAVLVGIGYKDMNGLREKKFNELMGLGYSSINLIGERAYVDPLADLGQGNIILGDAFIDSGCVLGDSNIIECGVHLSHDCSLGNYNYLSPSVCLGGTAKVGDRCFLGLNSTVRSAVVLHNRCLIGACAYVDRDVEDDRVIVPARSRMIGKKSSEMSILVTGDKQWPEYM